MLSVRVDAPAVVVALVERVLIPRGDPRPQAAVLAEREDVRARFARHRRRQVGRAVVDDEHVRVGKLLVQLLEHDRKVLLLVPGRDEDERAEPLLHLGQRRGTSRTGRLSTAAVAGAAAGPATTGLRDEGACGRGSK